MMTNANKPGRTFSAFLLAGLLLLAGGWFSTVAAQSQACAGVLGEAVVDQTFGSNAPYQLRPGQTTYTSVETCPNDGEYLIAGGLGCYPDIWHELPEDHTPGDNRGNMMIVNAAAAPGEFFNQSVPALCYGTTYEFSVWIINLVNTSPNNGCAAIEPKPLDPNILMRVELASGQVLQTIMTGTVARSSSPAWVRYATVFTLPAGQNSVVIKLINNGPGGCGNDLALDDIQLRPCRPQLQIQFSATTASTLSVCEGSTTPLGSVLGSGYANPAYQWQESTDSVTWRPVSGGEGGTYNAPASGTRYYRLLSAPVAGGAMPWDRACSAVSNTLTLKALSAGECSPPRFYAPDAFTPNNDGVNDRFRVYFDEAVARLGRFQLRVYNRWGSVIFVGDELSRAWDGTFTTLPCAGDVYAWVIDCELDYAGRVQHFSKEGRVLLIR